MAEHAQFSVIMPFAWLRLCLFLDPTRRVHSPSEESFRSGCIPLSEVLNRFRTRFFTARKETKVALLKLLNMLGAFSELSSAASRQTLCKIVARSR